mmetsp:Transcript_3985/g.9048  ORF Transcript_3985/g.9048 Transcript_3985/m.9048 type:complete len:110 (-) Transcript_3985:2475-2804(-)
MNGICSASDNKKLSFSLMFGKRRVERGNLCNCAVVFLSCVDWKECMCRKKQIHDEPDGCSGASAYGSQTNCFFARMTPGVSQGWDVGADMVWKKLVFDFCDVVSLRSVE